MSPRETVEQAISLSVVHIDDPVSNEQVQQELTPNELTGEEGIKEGVVQEWFAHEEQVPPIDLPLLEGEILAPEERGLEKELQST